MQFITKITVAAVSALLSAGVQAAADPTPAE